MGELIFFAVLVILSIIESAAKSRRQRKGGPLPEVPPEMQPEVEWPPQRRRAQRPTTSIPPSYDDDASFDARVSADEARSLEAKTSYDQAAAAEAARRRREASSSESMIPADIWAEIEGLARQGKVEPSRRTPFPKPQPQQRRKPPAKKPTVKPQSPPRPVTPKAPAPAMHRRDVEGTAEHPVHLAHAGYGTDPSSRAASAPEVLRPAAQASSEDAAAVRAQLRQGPHALRRALILQEVLGPPVAARPDPFEE